MTTDYNLSDSPYYLSFLENKIFIRTDGHIYRDWTDKLDEELWQKDGNIGIFKKNKKVFKREWRNR